LKFDGIENGQLGEPCNEGRIEYAYYLMAKAAGYMKKAAEPTS
jgi:serine/threonine-protein kinase HipA